MKNFKAGAELLGEGRVLGGVKDILQATLDKSGSLSSDLAPGLINARYVLQTALPLKQTLVTTYAAYLDAHKIEKPDIWAARDVVLPATGHFKPVRVAVWDSGVNTHLFPQQLLLDAKGKPALIAFDLNARRAAGELYPLPAELEPKRPEMLARTKGFSDLQSNIDSPEAAEVKAFISNLKPEQFKPAIEELGLAGNWTHGTHVAGIVAAGNPWVRLATARISFDLQAGARSLPEPRVGQARSPRAPVFCQLLQATQDPRGQHELGRQRQGW